MGECSWYRATLNQRLTLMEGFDVKGKDIIVVAATNDHFALDEALVRSGRFDKVVFVPKPNQQDGEDILRIHAKGVKLSSEVNFSEVAEKTEDFTGADLANLINQSAITAVKNDRHKVRTEDINQARLMKLKRSIRYYLVHNIEPLRRKEVKS
ncbi:MAG: AAA family ATPase [Candidatus Babeliales bacterium]